MMILLIIMAVLLMSVNAHSVAVKMGEGDANKEDAYFAVSLGIQVVAAIFVTLALCPCGQA